MLIDRKEGGLVSGQSSNEKIGITDQDQQKIEFQNDELRASKLTLRLNKQLFVQDNIQAA